MKDVNQPFIELVQDKGKMYVANKLGHKSTETTSKWCRDIKAGGSVPDGKYKAVYELLVKEEYLK